MSVLLVLGKLLVVLATCLVAHLVFGRVFFGRRVPRDQD